MRCHGSRGASARAERGGVVTGPEWHAKLVRLGMEAIDRVFMREYNEGTPRLAVDPLREAMNERMAQAAQAIVCEVEEARGGGDRERLDRIDATARALYAVLVEQPYRGDRVDLLAASRAYGEAAYAHAEALEEAREAWLAKRGKR